VAGYAERVQQTKATRANGRARRQAILAAAVEVFAERGYRGASLGEIAGRVGITQPGIIHHFGSKDELLQEVVQLREEQTAAWMTSALQGSWPLSNAIRVMASVNQESPLYQRLYTTLSSEATAADHPLHEFFVSRYRRYRRGLAAVLKNAQDEGLIRPELDTAAIAGDIIATLDGLHLQWLLDPGEVGLTEVLSRYAERLGAELSTARGRRLTGHTGS
jgi:AcrR family transcriptional regulator